MRRPRSSLLREIATVVACFAFGALCMVMGVLGLTDPAERVGSGTHPRYRIDSVEESSNVAFFALVVGGGLILGGAMVAGQVIHELKSRRRR